MSNPKLPPETPDDALPAWLQLEGVDLSAFKAEHRLEATPGDVHPPSDLEITVFGSPKKLKEQALAEQSEEVLEEGELIPDDLDGMPSTSEGLPLVIEEYVPSPQLPLPEPIFSNFNPNDSQHGLEKLLKLPEHEVAMTLEEIELPDVEDVEQTPAYRRPTAADHAPYLTFAVGEWTMSLPFDRVHEVVRVPAAGKFVDMRALLKLAPAANVSERRMLMIASPKYPDRLAGLVVDRVLGLTHVSAITLAVPEALALYRPLVAGAADSKGTRLVLLDSTYIVQRS